MRIFNLSSRRRTQNKKGGTKTWSAAVCAVLLLTVTGCNSSTDLVVNEDGSGSLTIEISVDDSLAELASDTDQSLGVEGWEPGVPSRPDWVPDDWHFEPLVDGVVGIRVSVSFDSLEELQQHWDDMQSTTDLFAEQDGKTFRVRLTLPEGGIDLPEGAPNVEDDNMMDGMSGLFDISFSVTLPGEINEERSNADRISGQTLIWDISLDDSGRILEAESKLPGLATKEYILIAAGLLAVYGIFAGVYITWNRRRKTQTEQPTQDEVEQSE